MPDASVARTLEVRHLVLGVTARGVTALIASAIFIAAGRLLSIFELSALGSALGAVVIGSAFLVWGGGRGVLVLTRSLPPDPLHADDTCRVSLSVRNDGRRPSSTVVVRDHVDNGLRRVATRVASMPAGARRTAGYRLHVGQRGRLRVGPLVAMRIDPFGFFERRVASAAPSSVLVLPRTVDLPGLPVRSRGAPGSARPRNHVLSDDDDRTSLRDYEPGDDLRRVHWPSSARTGSLVVRDPEPAVDHGLAVVLDTYESHHSATSFELAVSIAASLVMSGYRARLPVVFAVPGAAIEPDRGRALELLAELSPSGERLPLPELPWRAQAVFVTGPHNAGAPDELDAIIIVAANNGSTDSKGRSTTSQPTGATQHPYRIVVSDLDGLRACWPPVHATEARRR